MTSPRLAWIVLVGSATAVAGRPALAKNPARRTTTPSMAGGLAKSVVLYGVKQVVRRALGAGYLAGLATEVVFAGPKQTATYVHDAVPGRLRVRLLRSRERHHPR